MNVLLSLLSLGIGLLIAHAQPCESGRLDPRVARSLKTVLTDLPTSPTTSVEQIRNVKMAAPAFPLSDVQSLTITTGRIGIQVYNPAHKRNLPIVIYFHPGGFVTPLLPFMQYDCWRQATVYQAIVVAVDYRVAPEHKFPAAVDDAYNAFRWISEHGHTLGGDTSRIVLLGLSAGGNLAAVVCQKARQAGIAHKIRLQVLNCPSTDNPRNFARYPSCQTYASGYFLTRAFCQYSIQTYAPGVDVHHPDIAPIQRPDLTGLPTALIITAEFDPLRDEGYAYAERLKKAGVRVRYHCFPGQIHNLAGLPPQANELKQVDQLVLTAMRQSLNR